MPRDEAISIAVRLTLEAFESFNAEFQSITRRAKQTFEDREWSAGRRDAVERLDLYEKSLGVVATRLENVLGDQAKEEPLWSCAKSRFAPLIAQRYDVDRAETFFSSVTRKMLSTVGVNRGVEFFHLHPKATIPTQHESVYRRYAGDESARSMVARIFNDFHFWVPYENLERDVELVANEVDLHLWPLVGNEKAFAIDVAKAVFFRNKMAYIVGRIVADVHVVPLIIPLVNTEAGIRVDAVLLSEADANNVFNFAYSYFHVDLDRYDALIYFLRSILPDVDLGELYTSLGYNRHGKTELYRDLHRFVHVSRQQFVIAPGLEGAVMIVFTLPGYGFVFKVIKDQPCFLRSKSNTPKEITQTRVREQYAFVSHRDRAGRMVDTQEFENLRFKRKRFTEVLLDEFRLAANRNVTITDEYVILRHLYVQRKVVPLPMYFARETNPEAIRKVLIDFGYFLKDLAWSGVFPCDLFNAWNYGVMPRGRVVLYDYDDVVPMERVTFREKPVPRTELEEFAPEEDWIVATQEDFFLDELDRYSGIPSLLKGVFKSVHGDLYTMQFWDGLVAQLRNGEIFDIIPYDRTKRFHDHGRTM